ncbi:phage tail tape measure protein [Acinetobacter guerrae]|uniref:phage tail tape measure protein n=1 Tax=Acinetobacter guerrae TaxID=1843371 RepID=UPI00125F6FFF|nr:phage tail tape measure protein [Acinetobacter guerrae]
MANKKLNAVITIGGALAGSFRTVIGSTTKELGKIGTEINKVKQNQRQLGEAIRTFGGMGKNVDNLRSKYTLVTAELKKLENQQLRLSNVEKQRIANNNRLSEIKGQIGATIATGASLVVPVKLAIDFESGLADVKKTFNGTDLQFKKISDEALMMSTRLPMATNEILKIMAAGSQSGIAAKELTRFAEDAVKMGVAFDTTADIAGQAMAEMRTAFKMNQDQVVELADKINYLGNNTPAAAKAIMDIVQRIGPLGEVAGFASGSIAAMGATLRGMGISEEIAATGIKNTMLALVAGDAATKSQKAAYVKLGLDYKQISKDMVNNAEGTTLKVLKAVSKLEKHEQASVLANLFGKESLGAIAPLLTNTAALEKNLSMIADKSKYAGSMAAEYKSRSETTESSIITFKNTLAALGIIIGSELLPSINIALSTLRDFTIGVIKWTKANPELTKTIVTVVAGLAAFKIGLLVAKLAIFVINSPLIKLTGLFVRAGVSGGTFTKILKLMKTPISGLEKGFFALKNKIVSATASIFKFVRSGAVLQTVFGKLRGLGAGAFNLLKGSLFGVIGVFGRFKSAVVSVAQGVFRFATSGNVIRSVFNVALNVVKQVGLALVRTPWGIVATAAIGAALAIYKYWDFIKAFFSGFWQGLKQGIEPFKNAVGSLVQSTPLLSAAWNMVSSAVSKAFNWFKNLLQPVNATKEQIGKATSAGESFGRLVGGAIKLVLTPLKAVVSLFGWIINNVGKVGSLIDKVSNFKVGESIKSLFTGSPAKINTESKVSQPPKSIAAPTMKLNNFLGSTVRERNSNDGLQNSPKQVAPPPPIRATRPEQKTPPQVNFTNTFTINAQPGQSTDQIADDVIRKMKQAQGVQQRSLMVDWGYSQ